MLAFIGPNARDPKIRLQDTTVGLQYPPIIILLTAIFLLYCNILNVYNQNNFLVDKSSAFKVT